MILRLPSGSVVELKYIDSISHEAIRRILKKQNQAVATKGVGDSTQTMQRFHANMEMVVDLYKCHYEPKLPIL